MGKKVKEGWKKVRLGEVADINKNSVDKNFPYTGIEYVDISSVGTGLLLETQKYELKNAPGRARRLVKNGDTILSTVRPNRRSFLYIKNPQENLVVSTGFAVLTPTKDTDNRFLYYVITDQRFTDYLTNHAKGSAYPAIDTETIANAIIRLPSLSTQNKIASILSAYDDLIENNNRRIKILQEIAQSIYKEWFVNFRFPGHEKIKMIDSELGKIPEGWEVKRLGEICNIIMGQSPKSEFYNTTGEGLPFHQGVKDFGKRFPTHTTYCTIDNRIAEKGDILLSVRAPVGRLNIANTKLIIGRGLSSLRQKENLQSFLFYQLKTIFSEEDTMGSGAIFNAVTKEDLNKIKFLVPDNGADKRFNEIVSPIDNQIENLQSQTVNLRSTRDLLLPKLISGKLSLDQSEAT